MLKKTIVELFTQKFVTKLTKIWGLDPGSGKTYSGSGSRGQKGTGSGVRIRNTADEDTLFLLQDPEQDFSSNATLNGLLIIIVVVV
jgi:hypothetical protein